VKPLTALVLAGTRSGGDPMATAAGVGHKALIEIHGRSMIERVVAALARSSSVERIIIAIDAPDLLSEHPELRAAAGDKSLTLMSTGEGPSATVAAALRGEGTPMLVTTADHALLQAQWIDEFLAACPADADAVVAMARREQVQAAVPDTQRTYLRFSDGEFSGCNLFLLARPAASDVVRFWRQLESERKKPLRMIGRLGWLFALRYRFGRLSLAAAIERLGWLADGAKLAIVEMNDGRAAVDVDKPQDLERVLRLIAAESGTDLRR
jgi:GTP:adenosylcobinamide-phosphate guanylyltransferase